MDTHEQWPRHEEDNVDQTPHVLPAINGSSSTRRNSTAQIPGYTLMVAGQRSGKTSFLRLLLDTSNLAPTVSKEQVLSVARFVQGCSRHTTSIRHTSVDVILDSPDSGVPQPVTLTLIDTPSLNFSDEVASQRGISDILAHVDSRFAESVEKESNGNHHVHLCIYFLDPEEIVPPSREAPAVPVPPRARTGSLSQAEQPIILEPPVATYPELCRATLPDADINAIRRLSARVNVLPIVARADVLTNERLATIKLAIRNDLADAGIGFGIFDLDNFKNFQAQNDGTENLAPKANGDGSKSTATSSPPPATPSPVPPSLLRLPYALVSADIYAHSEGLSRIPPSRDDLVLQYTPSLTQTPISSSVNLTRGKFTRTFRWGSMDVLDPNHCDFIHLRTAIFHHMRTLQKYTKEYLFEKFRMEVQTAHRQAAPSSAMHPPLPRPAHPSRPQLPLPRGTRPIVALDGPHPASVRHPSLTLGSASAPPGSDVMLAANSQAGSSKVSGSGAKSQRTRSKKITVACNFCRSRKLKCDGGRPACGQCHKRSNPCDYIPHSKRRGAGRARKPQEDESGSEIDSGEELDQDPSNSPEVRPTSSRGNPSAENEANSISRLSTAPRRAVTQPEQGPRLSPVVQPHLAESAPPQYRPFPPNQDLPPIATLPVPPSTSANAENGSVLPPILLGDSHLQPQQPHQLGRPRKRSSTTGSGGRGSRSHYASKIVACNFCRARKTRCDGEHPTCGACSRRSLPCNYVNDGMPTVVKRKSVGDSPEQERAVLSPSSQSPPGSSSSHGLPLPNHSYGYGQHHNGADGDADMKRGPMDMDMDGSQPSKKMRFGG